MIWDVKFKLFSMAFLFLAAVGLYSNDPEPENDARFLIRLGEKSGYIDARGNVAIAAKYDRAHRNFSESLAGVRPGDRVLDDVGADDVVAGLGEAGAGYQADVSGSDDRYVHERSGLYRPVAAKSGLSGAPVNSERRSILRLFTRVKAAKGSSSPGHGSV